MANKVLVVDDEKLIVKGLKFSLEQDGMQVECAYDGEEALECARKNSYDMILLDIMLPKMDGMEVCQQIREFSDVPIIMLTVKARIKAILRRNSKASAKTEASSQIETGDMRMDCDSRSLFIHDKEVYLTAKEFDLLELLVLNPNKVYSRETLLNTIWGYDYPGDARTVDVHVRRLREKIEENPSEPKYVHTKWGVGYYFNV